MLVRAVASRMLVHEARALLARLAMVKSFALQQTSVPAAAVSIEAQAAIERYLASGRRVLRRRVREYVRWLRSPEGRSATPELMQHRFTMLRLGFNVVLSQFDIFSSALTQRSERETGVWLAGLDALANDALRLEHDAYDPPPLICYLDRGLGAAIRRVRTRLPGGGMNPVSIIRVPRERMVGSGIGASLIHEVGHQGAALLGLVPSLRDAIGRALPNDPAHRQAWRWWGKWISEILADFWAIAHLGVGATLGVMNVMSLPRAFVFRLDPHDPHPIPWIRVKLSCAMGRVLYPDAQWERLERLWDSLYPLSRLPPDTVRLFADLQATMPAFVRLLAEHRPARLRGRRLIDVFPVASRQPRRLAATFASWRVDPRAIAKARPALVFAVFGQAKVDGRISPETESRVITRLLTEWALASALESSENCATYAHPATMDEAKVA
jgi:hypothetical protein